MAFYLFSSFIAFLSNIAPTPQVTANACALNTFSMVFTAVLKKEYSYSNILTCPMCISIHISSSNSVLLLFSLSADFNREIGSVRGINSVLSLTVGLI